MTGLTTTGSTVIVGLDPLPRGLLLWRALLQGIGGFGIVITAIIILPFLRVGGMQLFRPSVPTGPRRCCREQVSSSRLQPAFT